jgi:RNA polymerase sigma-70 factor (ECF subfamily)
MPRPGATRNVQLLVEAHYAPLYRYAYRLSGSGIDAEDLVQETFCQAQAKLAQLRDWDRAQAWLFSILRNIYLHRVRSSKVEKLVSLDGMAEIPDRVPEPLPAVEPAQLQDALNQLPEGFRTPVILFYFEDFSYRDIAEHMDLPLGTVMSRLARAKAFLRGRLVPRPTALAPGPRRASDGLFDRPGKRELEAADRAALAGHLDACPDCAALARAEKVFDDALAKAMRHVPVPPDLEARVLEKLRTTRRSRPWRYFAAAAVLLLALGVGNYAFRPLPDLNPEEVPVVDRDSLTPEKLEEWFADMGVPIAAPTQFNYDYLESYDTVDFQGKKVPKLLFIQRGDGGHTAIAHVYVLSNRRFKFEDPLPSDVALSNHTITLFRHPELAEFVYLVVYTGRSLDPFIRQGI